MNTNTTNKNALCLMDAQPGECVALVKNFSYGSGPAYSKAVIKRTTAKLIFLEKDETLKFKKETGNAIGSHVYITVITQGIQDSWDKEEYTQRMLKIVRDQKDFSVETMKEVMCLLIASNRWEKEEQTKFILELWKLPRLPLETLKQALDLLEDSKTLQS